MYLRTVEARNPFESTELGPVASVTETETNSSEASELSPEILEMLSAMGHGIGSAALETTVSLEPTPVEAQEFPGMIDPVTTTLESGTTVTADMAHRPSAPVVERSPVAEDIDKILASSKIVGKIDAVRAARLEKQWRRNVREVNKSAVAGNVFEKRAIYNANLNMYNARGRRTLRKEERSRQSDDITARREAGQINRAQAAIARVKARGIARKNVDELAETEITKARTNYNTAREQKKDFVKSYGRRANTLRKNYARTVSRSGNPYSQTGEHLGGGTSTLFSEQLSYEQRKARQERELAALQARQKQEEYAQKLARKKRR